MLSSASLHCPSLLHPSETNCFPLPRACFSVSALYKLHSTCKPPSRKFQSPHIFGCLLHAQGRILLPIFALKKRGKGGMGLSELSDADEDSEGFFDEDGDDFQDDGGGDENEEEILLPLKKMKEWLERKPRGFGEGKEYDTSIEEKLLEGIEQSRVAQAANLNKLKNESAKPNFNKNVLEIKATETVNAGVRVRIVNLPKKQNIHRDLMAAFKEFPGITKITPAVAGNKKTRDPICKGFAFVEFESEGDAIRFTQAFSRQHVKFGKIQKQINCELVNRPTFSSDEISVGKTNDARRLIIPENEVGLVADVDMDDCSLERQERTAVKSSELANDIIRTRVDIEECRASISELLSDDDDSVESRTKSRMRSPSIKELERFQELEKVHSLEKKLPSKGREEVPGEMPLVKQKKVVSKKKQPEEKGEKKFSIEIPGSAKRLKVKEKAVLTDVYSRYGIKSTLVSKKEGN